MAASRERLRRLMDESQCDVGEGYVWNRSAIYAEREDRILSRLENSEPHSPGKDK